jgi:hypothetical protein
MNNEDYPFGENNIPLILAKDEIKNISHKSWQEQMVSIPAGKTQIEWNLKPTVQGKILRTQDLMVMEIIKANNWERPIYFTSTVYSVNKIGLDDYLSLEGLVFRLNPKKDVDVSKVLESNITSTYTYNGIDDVHLQNIAEIQSMYQNYRHAFMHLAQLYSENRLTQDSQRIIELMDKKIPEDKLEMPEKLKKEVEELRKAAS